METDVLRPMTSDEMLIWANHCKKLWPSTIRAHHFLLQQHQWHQKFETFDQGQLDCISSKCFFTFYTPVDSKPEDCTFVAISGTPDCSIFVHTLEDPPAMLETSIRRTNRIDYGIELLFTSTEERHLRCMKDILKESQVELAFDCPSFIYCLKRNVAERFEVKIPDNVRLSDLCIEDIPTVIDVWPHRYPGCESYVESVLRLNYGLGLYDKANGQLLAWVMRNEIGAVSFIQTVESAKRKGYATAILKVISKRLAARRCFGLCGPDQ